MPISSHFFYKAFQIKFRCFRAIKAGVQTPLLVLPTHPRYKNAGLVTLLGALEALYVVSIRTS